MFPRPIWCQRLSGGTSGSSRARDGCITWSTSQSHTSCCSAVLCQTRSHKGDSLGPWKISLDHLHRSTRLITSDMWSDYQTLLWEVMFGWWRWTWRVTLMNSDCRMDYMLKKKKKEKISGSPFSREEKARVNSGAPSTRNIQISINCPFDLTCLSNSLNLLGCSSFSE